MIYFNEEHALLSYVVFSFLVICRYSGDDDDDDGDDDADADDDDDDDDDDGNDDGNDCNCFDVGDGAVIMMVTAMMLLVMMMPVMMIAIITLPETNIAPESG